MPRQTPAHLRQLRHEGGSLAYELVYSRRKTLAIHVQADGRVVVRAPLRTDDGRIEGFLRQRLDWIQKHQARFASYPPKPPLPDTFQDGERYRYLGQGVVLRLRAGVRVGVRLHGEELRVTTPDPADAAQVAALVTTWFQRQARRVFQERLEACLPRVAPLGISAPDRLTIREMKGRWGTCSSRRRVTLNLKLIHLAPELIDYIITHELCHLREMNHSRAYYALLDAAMPDWRARKEALLRAALR